MQEYTTNSPVFTKILPLFETTTPAHADTFNDVNKVLFQNTMYLYNRMLEVHETKIFNNLSEMVSRMNVAESGSFKVGDNIFIIATDVPDLWVAGVQDIGIEYSYSNDEILINDLMTNGTIQCGIYTLARLEIGKVDLSGIQSDISELQNQLSGVETALASI